MTLTERLKKLEEYADLDCDCDCEDCDNCKIHISSQALNTCSDIIDDALKEISATPST